MDVGQGFVADECLSRAASIAYFTLFSLSPLLVVAIAIAGAVFGDDAAQGAVQDQLRGLLGPRLPVPSRLPSAALAMSAAAPWPVRSA